MSCRTQGPNPNPWVWDVWGMSWYCIREDLGTSWHGTTWLAPAENCEKCGMTSNANPMRYLLIFSGNSFWHQTKNSPANHTMDNKLLSDKFQACAFSAVPSVLWRCSLGGRKGIQGGHEIVVVVVVVVVVVTSFRLCVGSLESYKLL